MAAIPLKIGSEWRDASVSTGWQTMDTVRSETSEGSLASSRLDDGSGTSRSFSLHSNSSRVSIDSASMRSDYLSNFERKFLERKAAKHKHKERAKRAQAKADRQQLLSADEKRKAQREAERQARRREMEHWLTDPRELRRIELRSQKRSRDRMRALQEWYTPAISGATEEVQPVFVAAMNQEHSTHKRSIKPLLPTEAAAIKDKEDREAFQVVLQRQLGAFTSKLEYLEQFTDLAPGSSTQAKMRARHPKRRRRVEKDALHLAPLPGARGTLQASKSLCNHPPRHANRHKQLSASASLELLRSMSRSCTEDEEREVALDNTEVEEYLMRHRKGAKQIYAARKIQAAWRMHLRRRVYLPWRQRRMHHRRAIFEIWVMTHRVGNRAHRSLMRKYFNAWYVDVGESIQLREMELHLFRQAATQKSMPRMVINLVFTSDWERDGGKKVAASAATNVKNNNLASSSKAAFLDVFLSSAFAGVESPAEKGRSRVFQLRAQHQAAREEVRKKVVQHVFLIWKRLHEAKKRVGINAQLCLKRAVRMAFGSRQPKWDRVDGFLEDSLRLDAWDAYKELSAFFPMLFYGAFSDAASIFGGLPSHTYGENAKDYTNFPQQAKQEMQELQLATSGDAVRNFHGVLMRNSVVDVRNTILKERYLVNAIDDASGNTALHVAAQIEEPVRRLDILALLLSEGATTLNRANRHGLTPIQLAPDSDTSLLLREGIYAFYSRNILDRETMAAGLEDDHRLLCDADADVFFRKELFLLHFSRFSTTHAESEEANGAARHLAMELSTLLPHMQRKLRKAEKLVKRVQEHMLAAQDTIGTDSSGYGEDQNEDQSDDDDENNGDISAKEATSRPAQSSIATQYQLAAVALLSEGVPQRRSSILNTRRVVETYHRDGSSLGLFDPVGDTMLARYSASADLLFEEERRTAQEAERAQASMKKVEAAVILEQNPVTGQIEMAPDHVVSLSTISSTPQVKMAAGFENGAIPRNRKKEELQRAMIQRKFTCKPSDIKFNFGNFVTGGWGEDTGEQNITPGFNALPPEAGVRASATGYNTDAMWKRGGVKPTDRSAPSIKDVLANAQSTASATE
ncbi:hypothetical protein PHYBOEH_011057 [Phytophthora boehmeriae]|uniref:Uncharacterized protein n=1 Tax=Phytophthora boehmeriae TaxID=109152 RepID=A0A8T1XBV1_9STRA|nr:hypothetical protein PHYBOEH_011057 [Phytophthora boehmeriae]